MIDLNRKHLIRVLTASALVALISIPQSLMAQPAESTEHVVSPADLQGATVAASQARQKNLDSVDKFFSSEKAQKALKSAHIDPQQVKSAASGLSNEELAQLASRANSAQSNFAAGDMTDHDMLIVLIGIAALVLIIVAVDH